MLIVENLHFRYPGASSKELVFPSFEVAENEKLLIKGPSGSGKSTLMNLVTGWQNPLSGKVVLDGVDIHLLSARRLDVFRSEKIGIVHQQMFFIPSITARENLEMPFYLAGRKFPLQKMIQLAEKCGIAGLLEKRPQQLSQGEQQRLSIIRAVLHSPVLIFADEPTSSLDDLRADEVMSLLVSQASESGAALIVITHDSRAEKWVERRMSL